MDNITGGPTEEVGQILYYPLVNARLQKTDPHLLGTEPFDKQLGSHTRCGSDFSVSISQNTIAYACVGYQDDTGVVLMATRRGFEWYAGGGGGEHRSEG